jgi:hypothetical protein
MKNNSKKRTSPGVASTAGTLLDKLKRCGNDESVFVLRRDGDEVRMVRIGFVRDLKSLAGSDLGQR